MFGIQKNQFNFFKQGSALAVMLAFSTGHLVTYAVGMDLITGIVLAVSCFFAGLGLVYHIVFNSKLHSNALLPLIPAGLYCFSVFTFQGDLIIQAGAASSQAYQSFGQWKFFAFSTFVLCASAWASHRNAQSALTIEAYNTKQTIPLLLMCLFPSSHSYDFELAWNKVWKLLIVPCIVGAGVIWLSMIGLDPLQPKYGNLVVLHVALVLMILILHTHVGILIGEIVHVGAFCRKYKFEPLNYCDLDNRMKWRHDYVKYHLPAPIRALNLRLFNQHIEAYENHLLGQSIS